MRTVLAGLILVCAMTSASAATFGGYQCVPDCTVLKKGYEWAEEREVGSEDLCLAILKRWPNAYSFYRGCLAYVADPERGGDEDDDGNDIE